LRKRKRDPAAFDVKALAQATPGFSGAELEQAVVEALYDAFDKGRDITTEDVVRAARAAVPLSMTMREKIAYLRDWAQTRARDASSASPESIEEQTAAFLLARAEEEAYRRKDATKADRQPATDGRPTTKDQRPTTKMARPRASATKKTDGADGATS